MLAGDTSNNISLSTPTGRVAFSAHASRTSPIVRGHHNEITTSRCEVIDSLGEEEEKQQVEQDEKYYNSSAVFDDEKDNNNDDNANIDTEAEDGKLLTTTTPPPISFNETASSAMLSPRQGVSFREEFNRLPDFSKKPGRSASPAPPIGTRLSPGVATPVVSILGNPEDNRATSPFFNVTLNDFVGGNVPLLIGELPTSEPDYAFFWSTVNRLNICGVITVNLVRNDDKGTETTGPSLPWPSTVDTEAVYARKISARTIQIETFRSFQSNIVRIQDLDFGYDREIATWSFTSWPTSGHNIVPPLPHFYLDFLRTVIQQTYFSCRTGQPLLIVDRNGMDIAGLTAAVMMLLYQACEQRRADVWRCVADLRQTCRRNIVSRFAMYEFLYDCLLQVMCATPTIMSGNFRRAFRHLLRRGPPLIGPAYSPRSDTSSPRRVAPIMEQFELVGSLASMYRGRVVSKRARFAPESPTTSGDTKRSPFEARVYKSIRYFNLPSFTHHKHFLSVRGVVHVNVLLELMAKRCSRTLLWFSETPRADEILTGNQHDGVMIGEVSAYSVFYSYELEAPTSRGLWRITIVQFVGWPAFCGERPARPCRELIMTLRRAIEHADAVAASFSATFPPGEPPLKPVVTIYEADAGCCTWRGAMAALAASLDQRMSRFLEVDIFRTAQTFKIFDPESIVISPKQYTWCFKMAWASYLLSDDKARQTAEAAEQNDVDKNGGSSKTIKVASAKRDDELYNVEELNPYGSDKYLYSYPNMSDELIADEKHLRRQQHDNNAATGTLKQSNSNKRRNILKVH